MVDDMMRLGIPTVHGPVHNERWAIEGVPVSDLVHVWRRAWELLERAIRRFPDIAQPLTHDLILDQLVRRDAQLWIAWSYQRHRIEGAVVTRLITSADLPGKSLCEVPLWAGDNLPEWGGDMLGVIRAWADEKGCDYLVGYGRRGWKRVFGAREHGLNMDGLPILALTVREP